MPPVPKGSRVKREAGKRPPLKRRPRPRRKRIIPWTAIWGTLLLLTLLPAPFWSPVLRVRRATIVGATPGDAPAAEAALRSQSGRALVRVKAAAVESAALADLPWGRADLRRTPPGSLRLVLAPRVAVAVVVDSPPLLMDADGVVYDPPHLDLAAPQLASLPRVTIGRAYRFAGVSLAAPLEIRRLAELAVALRTIVGDTPVGIEVRDRGMIVLAIQDATVVLGTLNNLDAKLESLRRALEEHPKLFQEMKVVNLMAPDRPKVIPRTPTPPPTSDNRTETP